MSDSAQASPREVLTRERVLARIDAIRAVQRDPETAHAEEDRLHEDVLRAIATNQFYGIEAGPLAKLALETRRLGFPRWSA